MPLKQGIVLLNLQGFFVKLRSRLGQVKNEDNMEGL